MKVQKALKVPGPIMAALRSTDNVVVDYGYTKADIEFANRHINELWAILEASEAKFKVAVDGVIKEHGFIEVMNTLMHEKEFVDLCADLHAKYFPAPNPLPVDARSFYFPFGRAIIVAMAIAFGAGPALRLLSKNALSIALASGKALRNVFDVAEYNDASNFQADGISNLVCVVSYQLFPTKPRNGFILIMSFLDFPEDLLATVATTVFKRAETVAPETFH